MRLALLAALLATPLALAQEPGPGGAMIHTAGNTFIPDRTDNVTEGATMIAMNFDQVRHSLTAFDGSFDVELPSAPEGDFTTVSFVAPGPGEHAFRCRYHSQMTGVLVVNEPPAKKAAPGVGAAGLVLLLALVAWRSR